jgi:hypothetical protein
MHRKEINSVIFLGDCLETKKRGFREGVDDGGEIRQGNYGFYCNNDLEIDSFEESGWTDRRAPQKEGVVKIFNLKIEQFRKICVRTDQLSW